MRNHTVYYRLTKTIGDELRGEYFIDIVAMNFIHAIHKLKMSFGVHMHHVMIETVAVQAYGTEPRVLYDREDNLITLDYFNR